MNPIFIATTNRFKTCRSLRARTILKEATKAKTELILVLGGFEEVCEAARRGLLHKVQTLHKRSCFYYFGKMDLTKNFTKERVVFNMKTNTFINSLSAFSRREHKLTETRWMWRRSHNFLQLMFKVKLCVTLEFHVECPI